MYNSIFSLFPYPRIKPISYFSHIFFDTSNRLSSFSKQSSRQTSLLSNNEDKESLTDSNLENDEENIKSKDVDNIESSEKPNIEDENDNTLETVSFISQPASKTVKSKK